MGHYSKLCAKEVESTYTNENDLYVDPQPFS